MVVCSTGECAVEPVSRDVRHARQHFTVLYISVLCCHNWFIHNYLKPVCGENSSFYTNVIWSIIQFDGPLHVLSWFGRKGGMGDSQLFGAKMLVVPLRGRNSKIWYRLGCQRRNFDICIQCGTF